MALVFGYALVVMAVGIGFNSGLTATSQATITDEFANAEANTADLRTESTQIPVSGRVLFGGISVLLTVSEAVAHWTFRNREWLSAELTNTVFITLLSPYLISAWLGAKKLRRRIG